MKFLKYQKLWFNKSRSMIKHCWNFGCRNDVFCQWNKYTFQTINGQTEISRLSHDSLCTGYACMFGRIYSASFINCNVSFDKKGWTESCINKRTISNYIVRIININKIYNSSEYNSSVCTNQNERFFMVTISSFSFFSSFFISVFFFFLN